MLSVGALEPARRGKRRKETEASASGAARGVEDDNRAREFRYSGREIFSESANRDSAEALKGGAGGGEGGLGVNARCDGGGGAGVAWIVEEHTKAGRGAVGGVVAAGDLAGDAEAGNAGGVVELVVRERQHQHGATGTEGLGGGADAALMHDDRGAGKDLRVRKVIPGEDRRRKAGRGWIFAEEEQSATAELLGGASAGGVEVAGDVDGGGAEGEDNGGVAGGEESGDGRREGGWEIGPDFFVVKQEAGLDGVAGPVALRGAEDAGEEGEVEERGEFAFEDGMTAGRETKLGAELADGAPPGMRDETGDEAGETVDGGGALEETERGEGGEDRRVV